MADDFLGYTAPEAKSTASSVAWPDQEDHALRFPESYALQDGLLVRADAAAPAHDYSDGDEVETRIAAIIRGAGDRSLFSPALRAGITDWPSRYHLSPNRANLLRPFADRIAGRRVLEVGAGCGAISRYLGELAAGPGGGTIVALESSRRRAGIARLRTEDLPAVQVVCDDLFRFVPEHPFDVVVIVGVLEYARLFQDAAVGPEQALLTRLNGFLRPGGLMLLAIENQLGLKYLAGVPEDHLGQSYYGIENRYGADTPVTFGRRELDGMLRQAGFVSRQAYLPFPDYKMPSVVISPPGLSHSGFNAGSLVAEVVALGEDTLFALQAAWPVVAKNGLLEDLANSFLIVATTDGPGMPEPDADVLAWHYTTGRGYPFSKETRFVANTIAGDVATRDDIKVVRAALFPRPMDLEVPIDFQLETERYLPHETWWFRLVNILGRRGWTLTELVAWSRVWLDAFCARAGGCPLLADELVAGSLVDATPFNLIVRDGCDPVFIDQEWHMKPQLPLGFIAVRSLRVSICKIAHIARPSDPELFCVDRIVHALLTRHGLLLTSFDFDRYAQLEAMLQAWVTGAILPAPNNVSDESCSRPIQWHLPGGTSVQNCVIEEERRLHEAAVETERSKNAAAFERMCAEADQMRAEADQMRAEADQMRAEADQMRTEADQMRAEADQMRKAITVLTERSELAEINYRLIRYSISWRLTAPFRWMIGLLPSRLRGRLRQRLKRLSGRG